MRWLALVAVLGGCDVLFRLDHLPTPEGSPDAAPIVGRWIDVAAGTGHTCAIDDGNHLWCWGLNSHGETGTGTAASEIDAISEVGSATWKSVRSTSQTTCGIQTDGTLWCWGNNRQNQVLDPMQMMNVMAPVQVGTETYVEVAPGETYVCGIRSDQSLWCWGANDQGQLGTTTVSDAMVHVGSKSYLHVSTTLANRFSGAISTCAIDTDHALWCWGSNDVGQLGTGATGGIQAPTLVQGGPWNDVAVGTSYACAVTMAGQLFCWGTDDSGQLGDGGGASHATPMPLTIAGQPTWTRVWASYHDTCAITSDHRAFCWGASTTDQLGVETSAPVTPREVASGRVAKAVAVGVAHVCVLADDETLRCSGDDAFDQLGDGGSSATAPTLIDPGTTTPWQSVASGVTHTCALTVNGAVSCGGSNGDGELGIGNRTSHQSLLPVASGFSMITAGFGYSCGINNQVTQCWGANYAGQIGVGTVDQLQPVAVRAGATVSGFFHTCTIDPTSKQAYCWGPNEDGEVGNKMGAPLAFVRTPYNIPTLQWSAIGTGRHHTCAIHQGNNVVYCWGGNANGELGRGDTTAQSDPATATTSVIATQISLGAFHTCAIDASSGLSCWGANYAGQIGVGSFQMQTSPQPIAGPWRSVALGWEFTCGIRNDGAMPGTGTLWCWGYNDRGQLGIGSRMIRNVPTQVGTEDTWMAVAAGATHACAVKADHSLWCWGDNTSGQLLTGNAWRVDVQVP